MRFSLRSTLYASGFTMIEMIVAIGILGIIAAAGAGIFGRAIEANRHARLSQQAVEDAQFAINRIAKTLRTSSVKASSGTAVIAYDYSQMVCVRYAFVSDSITEERSAQMTDADQCGTGASFGSAQPLSVLPVTGRFVARSSEAQRVGSVTMVFDVRNTDAVRVRMQTTVSLRDYEVSGLL